MAFQENLTPRIYGNRRRGAPKHVWARKALEDLWEDIRGRQIGLLTTSLNTNREDVVTHIKDYARQMEEQEFRGM